MKKSSSKRFIYMKKIFTIRYAMTAMTAVALIATMATTSCTKTEELSGGKEKITTLDASLDGGTKAEAVIGGDETDLATGTKVAMTDNTTTMGVVWASGDVLRVFDGPSNLSTPTAFTLSSGATTKYGKFSGSMSATAGDQIYAIYSPATANTSIVNGINISLNNTPGSALTPGTNNINYNSVMYSGAKFTSGSVSKLTFKNAMVMIRIELPSTGAFSQVRAFSTMANIYNKASLTLSNGGTDGTALDTTWTARSDYGTRNILSPGTDQNFSDRKYIYFEMLPQPSCYGLGIALTPGGVGASATGFYYVLLSGTTQLVSGKYYKIPKSQVLTGALVSSSTAPTGSNFWYCTMDPSASTNLQTALQAATSNTAVLIASFTTTPKALQSCSKLETFVDNTCTALSANMFWDCTALKNVSIAAVAALPAEAFKGCTSLTEICLPSVKSLGSHAFRGCSALKKIIFRSIVNSESWSTGGVDAFNSIDPANNIDLVLKSGQTGVGVDGKTFNGITFKNISYKD